jgi:hypothetical protein
MNSVVQYFSIAINSTSFHADLFLSYACAFDVHIQIEVLPRSAPLKITRPQLRILIIRVTVLLLLRRLHRLFMLVVVLASRLMQVQPLLPQKRQIEWHGRCKID